MKSVLLAGAMALAAVTAVAAQPMFGGEPPEPSAGSFAPTADEKARENVDPDKVVCKTVKPVTGTRVSSARTRNKVCMTQREWDQQADEAKEGLRGATRGQFDAPGENAGKKF